MIMNRKDARASRTPLPIHQKGMVLIVGLVLLVVLSILAISYSQSALLQERLAGNFKDLSVAFQSSEAGVRWPAAWLQSLEASSLSRPFPCSTACDSTAQVVEVGQFPTNPTPKAEFWADARSYGIDPASDESLDVSLPVVKEQPKFVIEQQFFRRDDLAGDPQKGVAFYRTTSLGTGLRKNSDAIVRTVLAKRYE